MTDPGSPTAVADTGSGKTLVLMHGTLMDRSMFAPQLEGLAGSMRVIAYDSRARTPAGMEAHDIADLADDCCRLLDERGIEKAVIGGMSMGAFVALRVALRHPDRVAGLVLIGGQALAFTSEEQEYWGARYASRRGGKVGVEFAAEDRDFNFSEEVDARDPELREVWLRRFAERDGTAMHHEVQAWIGMDDVRDRLPGISVPALVIHGDRDASIPVEAALEMYRLLPDAELLVLPRTGHAANLERPEETNRAILNFMERISCPAP